jgi:hypothetical protein
VPIVLHGEEHPKEKAQQKNTQKKTIAWEGALRKKITTRST